MRNFIFTIAVFAATAVSAQDLSVNIRETYHGKLGIPDIVYVMKITNIEPNMKAWDDFGGDTSKMEYTFVAGYSESFLHTWTEQGVYIIFCVKDGEILGENTYFVITEKYVDFVVSELPGVLIEDTYVRLGVEYVAGESPTVVAVR